jgi:hypothetical protein
MVMKPSFFFRVFGILPRVLRVAAYFTFVAVVFLCVGARNVWGKAENGVMQIGSGLLAMGAVQGPDYTVRLNGQPVHLASVSVSAPVKVVLDHFQEFCHEQAGPGPEDLIALAAKLKNPVPSQSAWRGLGVLRKEADGEGVVACIVHGDAERWSLVPAVQEFSRTHDLQALGNLRYVVARKMPQGDTLVVTAWTNDSVLMDAILQRSGDAPGSDPDHAGRPPESRRLLTAGVDGSPYRVNVYESRATADAVLTHYDESLPQSGWKAMPIVTKQLPTGRAYSRAGVDLMVFTGKSDDGATIVSIVTMPPR